VRLQDIFFNLFLFFLPTQLAYHFWPSWSLIYGIRVDYLAPAIYLTDILFCLAFLTWVFANRQIIKKKVLSYRFFLLTLIYLVCAFINITNSKIPQASVYNWLKALELICIGIYTYGNWFNIRLALRTIIPFWFIFIFFISVLHFFQGRTIGGIFYFLGERSFNIATPGIALVKVFGKDFLRPYATFPHPNVMGGFVAAAMLLMLCLEKIFFKRLFIFIGILLIFLSFSQNAWGAFILTVIVFFLTKKGKSNTIWPIFKILALGVLIFSLAQLIFSDLLLEGNYQFVENIQRRLILSAVSKKVFLENPLGGCGLGVFIQSLPAHKNYFDFLQNSSFFWWLQPVHNIYLLLADELGLIGIIFLVYFICVLAKILKEKKSCYIFPLLIVFLTGSFDHYWLTLQQTRVLLVILIAAFLVESKLHNAYSK